MKILTSEQMKNAEKIAVENGESYISLMEKAGCACFERIRKIVTNREKKITVLCGRGNNGGDGFIISRCLFEDGYDVKVVLVFGEPGTETSISAYKTLKETECEVLEYGGSESVAAERIKTSDYIIDAILSTGLTWSIDEKTKELFSLVNLSKGFVLSIDIPSGINSDNCTLSDTKCYIKANATFAICSLKPCHVFYPSKEICGEITVVPIGISNEIIENCAKLAYYTLSLKEVASFFKKRDPISNKGDYGKVLQICGSRRMPGASVLCAKGALNSGAGLLTMAFPDKAYSAIVSKLNEPVFLPLKSDEKGFLSADSLDEIINSLDKADVVVIGCGLGVTCDTARIVCEVIRHSNVPIVIDADGINIISQNINILSYAKAPIILTPHPGEMSRLTKTDVQTIMSDRIQTVKKFVLEKNVTLALKGANTIVGSHDERAVYVNTTGNAGMSKGGSGDLLSGMIAGFIAQKINYKDAVKCGVFIHGMAGDIASSRKSMMSSLPSDTADCIHYVMKRLEKFL